ncbi:MAG: O-antigen ligase family protein [Terriglobales bacterium]
MLLRVPVGPGVPIAEALLIAALAFSFMAPSFAVRAGISILPFALWWLYGICRILADVPAGGAWAFRDGSQVIDSLFLIVGTCWLTAKNWSALQRWVVPFVVVATFYGLSYVARASIQAWSPKIAAPAGYDAALFSYTNTSALLLLVAAYLITSKAAFSGTRIALACLLVAFTVAMFQARTVYLQVFATTCWFVVLRRRETGKWMMALVLIFFTLAAIPVFDLHIQGRLGQQPSLEFLSKHVGSIVGIEAEGVEGAAGGVDLRSAWWEHIWGKALSRPEYLLFGRGFGQPLTDFTVSGGVPVREPHNSFISVFARLGLLGIALWIWMHWELWRAWFKAYRSARLVRWVTAERFLILFSVFFILVAICALGEDAFEKPFNAVPYYFFWGVVIRIAAELARAHTIPAAVIPVEVSSATVSPQQ